MIKKRAESEKAYANIYPKVIIDKEFYFSKVTEPGLVVRRVSVSLRQRGWRHSAVPFICRLVLFWHRNSTNNRALKSHRRARYASWMRHDAYWMAVGKPFTVAAVRVAILCERGVLLEIRTRGDVRETTFI